MNSFFKEHSRFDLRNKKGVFIFHDATGFIEQIISLFLAQY